jgi:hypothetical protein
LNAVISKRERVGWAGCGTWRIVTVVTGCRIALFTVENNVDPRLKIRPLQRPSVLVMSRHAGNLAGMAANTARGIGNNKSVHVLPFYYSINTSRDTMQFSDAFVVFKKNGFIFER